MAFAIFYNLEDAAKIAANVEAAGAGTYGALLTNTERQRMQRCWNGGLSGWAVAPLGQAPCEQPDPNADSHVVVVNASPNVTLQQFRDILYKIAASAGAPPEMQYLRALADDMGGCAGAVEPWP